MHPDRPRRTIVPGNMALWVIGRFGMEPTFALIAEQLGEMDGRLERAVEQVRCQVERLLAMGTDS